MDFPRPFIAHTTDGRTWQGCRFGIGYVVVMPLDTTGPDGWFVGVSLGALTEDPSHLMHGARIEWAANDTPADRPVIGPGHDRTPADTRPDNNADSPDNTPDNLTAG